MDFGDDASGAEALGGDDGDEDAWFRQMKAELLQRDAAPTANAPGDGTAAGGGDAGDGNGGDGSEDAWAMLQASAKAMDERCEALAGFISEARGGAAPRREDAAAAVPGFEQLSPAAREEDDATAAAQVPGVDPRQLREDVEATMEGILTAVVHVCAIREEAAAAVASTTAEEAPAAAAAPVPLEVVDTVAEEARIAADLEAALAREAAVRGEAEARAREERERAADAEREAQERMAALEAEILAEEAAIHEEEVRRQKAAKERRRLREEMRRILAEARSAVMLQRLQRGRRARRQAAALRRQRASAVAIQKAWRGRQDREAYKTLASLRAAVGGPGRKSLAEIEAVLGSVDGLLDGGKGEEARESCGSGSAAPPAWMRAPLHQVKALAQQQARKEEALAQAEALLQEVEVAQQAAETAVAMPVAVAGAPASAASSIDGGAPAATATAEWLVQQDAALEARVAETLAKAEQAGVNVHDGYSQFAGMQQLLREVKERRDMAASIEDLASKLKQWQESGRVQPSGAGTVSDVLVLTAELDTVIAEAKEKGNNPVWASFFEGVAAAASTVKAQAERVSEVERALASLPDNDAEVDDREAAAIALEETVAAARAAGVVAGNPSVHTAERRAQRMRAALEAAVRESAAALTLQRALKTYVVVKAAQAVLQERRRDRAGKRIAASALPWVQRRRGREMRAEIVREREAAKLLQSTQAAEARQQQAIYDGPVPLAAADGGGKALLPEPPTPQEDERTRSTFLEAFDAWVQGNPLKRLCKHLATHASGSGTGTDAPPKQPKETHFRPKAGRKLDPIELIHLGEWWRCGRMDLTVEDLGDVSELSKCAGNLVSLNLSVNKLEAESMTQLLPCLPKLQHLSLKDNILGVSSDSALHAFGDTLRSLPDLKTLDLSMNKLRGGVDWLWKSRDSTSAFSALEELRLDNNRLNFLQDGGGAAAGRVAAPRLRFFSAFNNQIGPNVNAGAFLDSPLLAHLDLGKNRIETIDEAALSQAYPLLMILVVSDNRLPAPPSALQLPLLQQLWLSQNRITDLGAWEAGDDGRTGIFLPSLRQLVVRDNQLDTLPATCFAACPNVTDLDVSFNNIAATAQLEGLHRLGNLGKLEIQDNPISRGTADKQETRKHLLSVLPSLKLYCGDEVPLAESAWYHTKRAKACAPAMRLALLGQHSSFGRVLTGAGGAPGLVNTTRYYGRLARSAAERWPNSKRPISFTIQPRNLGPAEPMTVPVLRMPEQLRATLRRGEPRIVPRCPSCHRDTAGSDVSCQVCGLDLPRACPMLPVDLGASWIQTEMAPAAPRMPVTEAGVLQVLNDGAEALSRLKAEFRREQRQYDRFLEDDGQHAYKGGHVEDFLASQGRRWMEAVARLLAGACLGARADPRVSRRARESAKGVLAKISKSYADVVSELEAPFRAVGAPADLPDTATFRDRTAVQEAVAATQIQASWRRRSAIVRVETVRVQTRAAAHIQAAYRGWRVRRRLGASSYADAEVDDILAEGTDLELQALMEGFDDLGESDVGGGDGAGGSFTLDPKLQQKFEKRASGIGQIRTGGWDHAEQVEASFIAMEDGSDFVSVEDSGVAGSVDVFDTPAPMEEAKEDAEARASRHSAAEDASGVASAEARGTSAKENRAKRQAAVKEKKQKQMEEWGFKDPKTLALMRKRQQKMRQYEKAAVRRERHKDPLQRLNTLNKALQRRPRPSHGKTMTISSSTTKAKTKATKAKSKRRGMPPAWSKTQPDAAAAEAGSAVATPRTQVTPSVGTPLTASTPGSAHWGAGGGAQWSDLPGYSAAAEAAETPAGRSRRPSLPDTLRERVSRSREQSTAEIAAVDISATVVPRAPPQPRGRGNGARVRRGNR